MVKRHKRRFSLPSLPLREVDAIDRRSLFERSELRSRGEGRGGMALKIFSKAESFHNLLREDEALKRTICLFANT